MIRIVDEQELEARLKSVAIDRYKKGSTYLGTLSQMGRDALTKQYADYVAGLYRKAPEYRKDEVLEMYGVEAR